MHSGREVDRDGSVHHVTHRHSVESVAPRVAVASQPRRLASHEALAVQLWVLTARWLLRHGKPKNRWRASIRSIGRGIVEDVLKHIAVTYWRRAPPTVGALENLALLLPIAGPAAEAQELFARAAAARQAHAARNAPKKDDA